MAGISQELPVPAVSAQSGPAACGAAQALDASVGEERIRSYFDRYFQPYAIVRQTGPLREDTGLITGYYEPLLKGSRDASAKFSAPLYAPPADLLTIDLVFTVSGAEGQASAWARTRAIASFLPLQAVRSWRGTHRYAGGRLCGGRCARRVSAPGAGVGAGAAACAVR